jgi:RNA polymerase subunit RPABC4/transcription elongation factor Spt4
MEKEAIVCPRCDTFIGKKDDLDSCPVCGKNLISEDDSEK